MLAASITGLFIERDLGGSVFAEAQQAVEQAGNYRTSMRQTSGDPNAQINISIESLTDATSDLVQLQMSVVVAQRQVTCELIIGDDAWYAKVPEAKRREFGGKGWLQTEPSATFPGVALSDSVGTGTPTFDEDDYRDVQRIGEEAVRGAPATKYTADVATDSLDLTGDQPAIGQVSVPETIPVEAWVDDEGRLARMTLELPVAAANTTVTTELEIENYDFGTADDVVAPSAAEFATVPPDQAFGACFA